MTKHWVVVFIVKIAQSALNCDDIRIVIAKSSSEKVQRGFLSKAQTIVQLSIFFMFNIDFVRYQNLYIYLTTLNLHLLGTVMF